jgi:hypothetical protein
MFLILFSKLGLIDSDALYDKVLHTPMQKVAYATYYLITI